MHYRVTNRLTFLGVDGSEMASIDHKMSEMFIMFSLYVAKTTSSCMHQDSLNEFKSNGKKTNIYI